MKLQYVSLIIICSWAVIMSVLEQLFPYKKGQKFMRKGFWMDFWWYTIVQSYFLSIVIAWIITSIDNGTGWSRLKLVYDWPIGLQILFFLVTHEFWQYWFHRLQHSNKWFWRTHEAAHATPEVDWLVGSRSHAFEILIAQTIEFAPIILLGARPEVAILKGTIDAVWGMYNHSNIKVNHGWLIYIFNGPQLHRWHHAKHLDRSVNFATKLSIWDWMFGTAYLPEPNVPPEYGLKDETYPNYSYFKQLIMPFRPWKRKASTDNTS